jgi:hypothetical protein
MAYQARIAKILDASGFAAAGVTPRHAEAWMRLEHGTLDALSSTAFVGEVIAAARCTVQAGAEHSDALASSFGL